MSETKRIEVDIGAAVAMLEASPELAEQMNELIGGPALVAAHAEIERLQQALTAARERGRIAGLEEAAKRLEAMSGPNTDGRVWRLEERNFAAFLAREIRRLKSVDADATQQPK